MAANGLARLKACAVPKVHGQGPSCLPLTHGVEGAALFQGSLLHQERGRGAISNRRHLVCKYVSAKRGGCQEPSSGRSFPSYVDPCKQGILPSPPSPREELRSKSKSSKASHTLKSLFAGLGANGAVRTGRSETQVLEEAADPGFNDDADFRPPTGTRSKPEPAGPKASTPRPGSVASVRPRYAADRLSNKPKPSRAATVSGVLDLTRPATSGSLHLPSVRSRARPAAQTIDVLDTMTSDLFASAEEKSAARRLSFAEESLDEVAAAIREEEPELDWLQDTCNTKLRGSFLVFRPCNS